MTHRKIGGIHWFRFGRLCISVCIAKPSDNSNRLPKRSLTLVAAGATANRMPQLPHISEGPMV